MASSSTITIQSIVERETSHFGFEHLTLTPANVAAYVTTFDTFTTALDAIIRGVIKFEVIKYVDDFVSGDLPASQDARRELKLLVRYQGDVSGDTAHVEIATPDLSALTLESGDANFVVLADAGVMATFVTAFEAIVTFPGDPTESTTILSAQIVGRNI
jgi:hypothetical protein